MSDCDAKLRSQQVIMAWRSDVGVGVSLQSLGSLSVPMERPGSAQAEQCGSVKRRLGFCFCCQVSCPHSNSFVSYVTSVTSSSPYCQPLDSMAKITDGIKMGKKNTLFFVCLFVCLNTSTERFCWLCRSIQCWKHRRTSAEMFFFSLSE